MLPTPPYIKGRKKICICVWTCCAMLTLLVITMATRALTSDLGPASTTRLKAVLHDDETPPPLFSSTTSSSSASSPLSLPSPSTSSSSSSSSSRHRRQILLVTYGRSGSSLTSALLGHHPSVWFMFEPLFVLQRRDDAIFKLWSNKHPRKSMEVIKAFLTCDFSRLSGADFDNGQFWNGGQSSINFNICIRKQNTGFDHVGCFLQLMRTCLRRSVSFVKTIRFKVDWAQELLDTNPNFKLLYLIRDPRAVLFSQSKVFKNFAWPAETAMAATFHCGNLSQDLAALQRFRQRFPDRVKVIRYEAGALDPVAYARDLYHWAGLPFSQDTVRFVHSLTNASKPEVPPDSYSVTRHNWTSAMNHWRYLAGFKAVSGVDRICGALYPQLGYSRATSQRDLESSRPLVGTPSPGNVFDGFFRR